MALIKVLTIFAACTMLVACGGGGGGSSTGNSGGLGGSANFTGYNGVQPFSVSPSDSTTVSRLVWQLGTDWFTQQFRHFDSRENVNDATDSPGTFTKNCSFNGDRTIVWTSPGDTIVNAGDTISITLNDCNFESGNIDITIISRTSGANYEESGSVNTDITRSGITRSATGDYSLSDVAGSEVFGFDGDFTLMTSSSTYSFRDLDGHLSGTPSGDVTLQMSGIFLAPASGGSQGAFRVTLEEDFFIPAGQNPTSGSIKIEGSGGNFYRLEDEDQVNARVRTFANGSGFSQGDDWTNYNTDL